LAYCFKKYFRQSPNKALHWTAIPLRSIAAGELWRCAGVKMKWIRRLTPLAVVGVVMLTCSCSRQQPPSTSSSAYPVAVDFEKIGKYPALTKSGAGYVYDEVLEYRVWVHPGGDDYYRAFATYEDAKRFSERTERAEEPLVLVLQREHINEPEPGKYVHVKGDRITEWRVEWLAGKKRGPDTIPNFLKEKAKESPQPAASPDPQ
jgi:putative acetyltransferase